MASPLQKIVAFLKSPRGQRLIEQGRRELAKPSTQHKLRQLAARFNRRRR
jgi:hypothetical protein